METTSLRRALDFKLVYDCLADSNSGLVRLDLLTSSWPTDLPLASRLRRDCIAHWRRNASSEGYLDWRAFSGGLEKALEAEAGCLSRGEAGTPSQTQETLHSGQPPVTSGEIERFLSSCKAESLVKALSRAGRDVHRWQVCMDKLNTTAATANTEKSQDKSKIA